MNYSYFFQPNQNHDFTRLIDDERSLTLNDPVTLGKFNPWLPAYANQLHPYLIVGQKVYIFFIFYFPFLEKKNF